MECLSAALSLLRLIKGGDLNGQDDDAPFRLWEE